MSIGGIVSMQVERQLETGGDTWAHALHERMAQTTDARVDRLVARIQREVEAAKMNAIMRAMVEPRASGPLYDETLIGYYARVAHLLDIEGSALEVVNDRYTVYALIKVMQDRLPTMLLHFHRVSEICVDVGKMMGLAEKDLSLIDALGVLHDVGKLGISDEVLFKQDPLTSKEWEEIRLHSSIGYKLIHTIRGISELAAFVVTHHERWDGKGYPLGLRGEEIPLLSRILTLADSIDAMIDDRPYRRALSSSDILAEIERCGGSQFDPEVVEAFFAMIREGWYTMPFLSSLREVGKDSGPSLPRQRT